MLLLLYSRCPKPFQIPGLGTGTRLSHAHTSEKRIFRPAYYFTVGANNAVKCYIISAVIWLHYLQSSVFISISQSQKKLEPPPPPQVEFTKEAFQFQNTSWENHDLTEQPVITSVYCVREFAYVVLFMLFFKTFL